MAGRPFADVLDEALGAYTTRARTRQAAWSEGTTDSFRLPPRDPFLFFRLPDLNARVAASPRPAAPPPPPPAPEPEPPRVARTLTRAQQQALDALNGLGAGLTAAFDLDDLRRAYRRLAFRLHPDRHQDASPAERVRLSHAFGAAAAHYRVLLGAFAGE
ncbi:MAG: J domain-containing protein [Vicinamibacterales bacterium]